MDANDPFPVTVKFCTPGGAVFRRRRPRPMSRYGYAPGLQPEPGFGEYARAASRGPRFGDVSRATLQERLTTPRTNYNTSPPEPLADYRGPVLVNTKDTMCWRQRIVVENLAA
jgi:hypothetical protein